MAYKLTVITPAYNSAATLPAALASLRAQTLGFENIEYIVAFDTSTDATGEIARSWAARYDNVKCVELSRAAGGPGAARNAALDMASAPYVMFLDSDDVYSPRACEALVSVMDSRGCDIASGDFRTVVYDNNGRVKSAAPSYERFPEGEYDLSRGITPAAEPFISAFWCKIFRRDIIEKHALRMRARSLLEELMFLTRYLGFCARGYYLKENVADYTVRGDSASRDRSEYFFVSSAECITETVELCARDGKPALVADYLKCSDLMGEHIDWLLAAQNLAADEFERCLAAWKSALAYCEKYGVATYSPAARLLMADAAADGGAYEYDARELREYAFERRCELDGIFASNTWRLAQFMQKLSGKRS